ncbi:hypothetical protein AQV86_03865 [Nanohaloarchaea archaeon SG9]|nr:hypothetical protein AQV86_03865 [Nanohaloarchaea archaeon SG9]
MSYIKEVLQISDVEFWKEIKANWNHGSMKDQMFFCLFLVPLLGFLIFYENSLTKVQAYFTGGILTVIFISILNTWAFAKVEYEKRNYRCPNCGNPMEHRLTEDHNCQSKQSKSGVS